MCILFHVATVYAVLILVLVSNTLVGLGLGLATAGLDYKTAFMQPH